MHSKLGIIQSLKIINLQNHRKLDFYKIKTVLNIEETIFTLYISTIVIIIKLQTDELYEFIHKIGNKKVTIDSLKCYCNRKYYA